MKYHLLPLTLLWFCLSVPVVGCGPRVTKNPLAGVGGYRLVYKQRDHRAVEAERVASALRTLIQADNEDSVVARLQEDGSCEILLPAASEERVAEVKKAIANSNLLQFRIVAIQPLDAKLIAAAQDGQDPAGGKWIPFDPNKVVLPPEAAVRTTSGGKSMALVVEDDQPVDAWHIAYASMSRDEQLRPSVMGNLNGEGTIRMEKLTSQNRDRQLAIIVEGRIASAPTIQSTISDLFQITGEFAKGELEDLVVALRTRALGSLEPVPVSETKVEAAAED